MHDPRNELRVANPPVATDKVAVAAAHTGQQGIFGECGGGRERSDRISFSHADVGLRRRRVESLREAEHRLRLRDAKPLIARDPHKRPQEARASRAIGGAGWPHRRLVGEEAAKTVTESFDHAQKIGTRQSGAASHSSFSFVQVEAALCAANGPNESDDKWVHAVRARSVQRVQRRHPIEAE